MHLPTTPTLATPCPLGNFRSSLIICPSWDVNIRAAHLEARLPMSAQVCYFSDDIHREGEG